MMRDPTCKLGREILVEGPSGRDREGLHPAANAEHGDVALEEETREGKVPALPARVERADRRVGGAAVVGGVEVVAPGEEDSVEAREERGEVAGTRERWDEDGEPAGRRDGVRVDRVEEGALLPVPLPVIAGDPDQGFHRAT